MTDSGSTSPTICILSPLAGGFYFGDLVAGADAEARRHGARILVTQTSLPWPEQDEQPRPAPLMPLAWDHIDGFVVVVDALDPGDLRMLASADKPLVTVSMLHPDPHGYAVFPDNHGGALAAVRHLIGHGHSRIAFAGYPGQEDIRRRHQGYQDALAEHGIVADPALYFAAGDNLERGGREAATALLAAGLPCTSIFVATDRNALALIEMVQAAGYRVPEDLAVVSYDDLDLAQQAVPALTSVRQRFDALGAAAVGSVLAAIAGEPIPASSVLVPTALICRHSCGCAGMQTAGALPDAGYAGSDWRDLLGEHLAHRLIAPLRYPSGTPPAQLWPGVDLLISALEAAVLGSAAPPSASLDQVWQAACARTRNAESLDGILTLLERAGLARQRHHYPGEEAIATGLHTFLDRVRIQILRSSMTDTLRLDRAQQAVSSISRTFLKRHAHEATDLSWMALAGVRWGCLAIWADETTGAGRRMRIAGSYSADRGATPGSGELVCPQAFPTAAFLDACVEQGAAPAVMLIPLGTPDRDWGILAVVGPTERQFYEAHDAIRHGATELTLAMEHAALLHATELQRERLRESEQRYWQVEEHASIGLALVAPDGRWLRVNPALRALVGYTEEELLARTFQDITHPDDLDADLDQVRRMLAGEIATFQMEKRYIRKDKTLVWVLLSISLVRDTDGHPQYLIAQVQDIGERKQVEQAQEQARAAAEELALLRQQQAEEAEAMAAVGVALASALDPGAVYRIILTQAARVLPFDHAEIALYRDGWVVSVATLGGPEIQPETPLVQINPTTSTWQALSSGRADYLADTTKVPDWADLPPWCGQYRIRSMIIAPLLIDGELIGSFKVSSYTPHFYTEHHIQIATVFGERATLAVRNARLYAAEQARARAAEELANLRSDFVAAVSHELRTPLTAIVGFGELLLARWGQFSEARRLERIGQIVQAATRQKRLVEDLLLVSRLEGANLAPRRTALLLAPLVRQTVAEVQGSYPGQRMVLQGPDGQHVLADAAHVTQILTNLVDNAAKYSPEGSPITVCWGQEEDMAVLRVIDQGSGLPPEGRDQLFTRFGRMPGSRMRAGRVGTGLGLYISRGLAEAMGGDLDLESTGPEGSTFRLRLPVVPD